MSIKPNAAWSSWLKHFANEKGMSWCLEHLKNDMTDRKSKTLGIFQSVHLLLNGPNRQTREDITTPQRNAAVVSAYKYAAGAFLEWLEETHDFRAPSWLTVGVMG